MRRSGHWALLAALVILCHTPVPAKEWPGPEHGRLNQPLKMPSRPPEVAPAFVEAEFSRFKGEFGEKSLLGRRRATGAAWLLWGFKTPPLPGTPVDAARDFLKRWTKLLRLSPEWTDLEYRDARAFFSFVKVSFQQVFGADRAEVRGAEVHVYLTFKNEVWQVFNSYLPGIAVKDRPKFTADQCLAAARRTLGIKALRGKESGKLKILPQATGDRFVYELVIPALDPFGTWEVVADAVSECNVLASRDLVRYKEGRGRVFDPNPIVAARDGNLRARSPLPEEVYRTVTLRELTVTAVGTLTGAYADTSPTQGRARSPSLDFRYSRPMGEFAETMAYYHITETLRYLETLGLRSLQILGLKPPVKPEAPILLPVRIDAYGRCYHHATSCFVPDENKIVLGSGGAIPDGEDAHVIVHELGHAVLHHRSQGFDNTPEAGAIAEGFADYLAASRFAEHGFEPACIAPWDTSERRAGSPPCLRRVDTNKTYDKAAAWSNPDVPWQNAEIWSGVLWKIRQVAKPTDLADLIIIEAHSGLPKFVSMRFLGRQLLSIDQNLTGGKNYGTIANILRDRKIPFERP